MGMKACLYMEITRNFEQSYHNTTFLMFPNFNLVLILTAIKRNNIVNLTAKKVKNSDKFKNWH